MRSLRAVVVVGMVLAIALTAVSAAGAATEVGDECVGNSNSGPFTMIPEAHASGGGLQLAAPTGGVVTEWKVNSALAETVPEFMAAFRPTGQAGTFQVIGESDQEDIKPGLNVFPTRIPVHAGDRFGPVPVGEESPVFCATTDTGDRAWSFRGSVGVGSIHTYAAGVETRVPLVAVIEPDGDGDGYGDESQDKCPQSAAYQGPCPTITLEAFPVALKRSVLVLVSASETTQVQVFGQVSWKPRHRGGALASKTRKTNNHKSAGITVGLLGDTQIVKPGEVARFNIKLPKTVKRQLRQVPSSKSLKGTITARTVDLASRVTDRVINIHLRGQEAAGR